MPDVYVYVVASALEHLYTHLDEENGLAATLAFFIAPPLGKKPEHIKVRLVPVVVAEAVRDVHIVVVTTAGARTPADIAHDCSETAEALFLAWSRFAKSFPSDTIKTVDGEVLMPQGVWKPLMG